MRATFFVLGLMAAAVQAATQPADLIVHDARIHTVDATHPQVAAMAVRAGRELVAQAAGQPAQRHHGPVQRTQRPW